MTDFECFIDLAVAATATMGTMAASNWGPSHGLLGPTWRDTAGQAAIRLMMELSMLKGRLCEQEARTVNAEEKVRIAAFVQSLKHCVQNFRF